MVFGIKTARELIADLRIEVRELTSRVMALETEWDDTYDKMTRKAARDRKRARDEAEAGDVGPSAGLPSPADGADRLPPRVLARRRNHGLPAN